MAVKGIGIDLVELDDFRKRLSDELIQQLFLPGETAYCRSQVRYWENFAARFAAKEALFKALGAGLSHGLRFTDVEVIRNPESGAVSLSLTGRARVISIEKGIDELSLSISHTRRYAVAVVLAQQLREV